jgi:hypothetical protein
MVKRRGEDFLFVILSPKAFEWVLSILLVWSMYVNFAWSSITLLHLNTKYKYFYYTTTLSTNFFSFSMDERTIVYDGKIVREYNSWLVHSLMYWWVLL